MRRWRFYTRRTPVSGFPAEDASASSPISPTHFWFNFRIRSSNWIDSLSVNYTFVYFRIYLCSINGSLIHCVRVILCTTRIYSLNMSNSYTYTFSSCPGAPTSFWASETWCIETGASASVSRSGRGRFAHRACKIEPSE